MSEINLEERDVNFISMYIHLYKTVIELDLLGGLTSTVISLDGNNKLERNKNLFRFILYVLGHLGMFTVDDEGDGGSNDERASEKRERG